MADPKNPEHERLLTNFILEHVPRIMMHIKSLKRTGKLPQHIENEDLVMHGIEGLYDAVHRYDPNVHKNGNPNSENPFLGYADHRIRGRLLDHAKHEFDNHVPEVIRNRAKERVKASLAEPKVSEPAVDQEKVPTLPGSTEDPK